MPCTYNIVDSFNSLLSVRLWFNFHIMLIVVDINQNMIFYENTNLNLSWPIFCNHKLAIENNTAVEDLIKDLLFKFSGVFLYVEDCSLLKQVIWTSFQRFFNVIDVRWTSKQRCVLTGFVHELLHSLQQGINNKVWLIDVFCLCILNVMIIHSNLTFPFALYF